ncbi:MAG: putative Ig domain-containing protein, partial [Hyphomicrobiales bacterium]|nr:putative Ig domain-containing protein [Hyphomicrobiales bacterium]
QPPVTTTALPARTVVDGTSASISTASGFSDPLGLPLTYSATGLPAGLSINATTGVISGTVDHNASISGPYTGTVTASDGQGGSVSQSFAITSTNQAPTLGTATSNQSNSDGALVAPVDASKAFVDPNTGDTVTYTASGLPAGLSINAATGVISGTIANNATPGSYSVTVIATDNKGAATPETFTWNVADVPPVTTTALPAKTVVDGTSASINTASGFSDPLGLPLTYSAAGLPAGLSINATTGVISGTVDHNASISGPYSAIVTASDGQGGSVSQSFAITSTNQAPTLGTATSAQANVDGALVAPVDASKAFVDPNTGDTVTYTASGLPAGLSIDATTGVISGTIANNATPGSYSVTVTATDNKGAATPETFTWDVKGIPIPTTAGTGLTVGPVTLPRGSFVQMPTRAYTDVQTQVVPIVVSTVNDINALGSIVQDIGTKGIVDATVNAIADLHGGGLTPNFNGTDAHTPQYAGHGFGSDDIHAHDLFEPAPFLGSSVQSAAIFLSQSLQANGARYGVEAIIRDRVLYIDVRDHQDDRNGVASVGVTLADGRPAPSWLQLDRRGLAFGKIPAGMERLDLEMSLVLHNGLRIRREISVDLSTGQLKLIKRDDHSGATAPSLTRAFAQYAPRQGWNASHLAAGLAQGASLQK